MRFGKNMTASLMAAMMTLSSVVSPFSAMDVRAEGVVDEFTVNQSAKIAGETKTESVSVADGMENISAALAITKTAQYNSGIVNEDGGSAEIVKYNSDNHMYYVVNGTSGTLDIVPRDTEKTGVKLNLKQVLEDKYPGFSYGDMTSVDVCEDKELIAVAVQAEGTNEEGKVVFLDYDNEIVKVVTVGVQPDMLTFTKNGKKVLVANEGEPRDGYDGEAVDPQGSISIIDLNNINGATVKTVTFEDWDEKRDQLAESGVIIKKNTAPSVDFEPEFIAANDAGTKAYVALQEANAIATLDVKSGKITDIQSLGFKNHNLTENALDMMKDDVANIKTEDAYGIYMPDGIAVYEADGKTYILTANEGDSREWGNYLNEKEVEINGNEVVTFDTADYDGVDEDKIYLFGARSFAIYDAETMEQVYESGSDFEEKTLVYFPENFNCSNDKNKLDNRSGKKGPEAESVVTGVVGDKTYAFIGLERIGGVMVYDITNPAKAAFVNYINTRDFSEKIAGDVSPEGLCFVEASESFSGNAELIVANEVSGTVAIYEMTAKKVEDTEATQAAEEAKAAAKEAQAALEKAKTAKAEAEAEAAKAAAESADAEVSKMAAEAAKAAAAKAQAKAEEAQEKAEAAQTAAEAAQAAATTEAEKAAAAQTAAEAAQAATEAAKVAAETAKAAAEAAQSAAEKAQAEAKAAAEAAKADRENAAKAEAAAKAEKEAAEAAKAAAEAAKAAAEAAAQTAQAAADKAIKATETPKKVTLSKVTSTKKKQVKVTWKKDTKASGYQVVCATNKSFTKNVKKISVTKKTQTSLKINKLTSKKKVYVKVRSYKTVDGKKLYGKYSAVKSVKVK